MKDTTNNNAIYSVLLNSDFTIKNTYSAQPKFTLDTILFWNGSYWLAGTNRLILTSIDGITFTLRYTSTIYLNVVKWTGVCWVVTEQDDEGLNYNLITSRDGIRWNKKNIYSSASIYAMVSLAYNNYDIEVCVKVQNTNSFFTYSITTKILYLHSLANIYKGPPIPINYALENPSYLTLRVTKEQVPDNFSALRLRLVNISKNNTIQIAKSNTALTTVNNVSSCNVTLFPVSTGNKINFGLIQFEGKKNNKWYTIAYITRKNYIVP